MSEEKTKLAQDVFILKEMSGEIVDYLRSDVLFWPMMKGGLPRLTLGGCLLRQHRLLALRDLLSTEEQAQVDTAVTQFNQALIEKTVRFEQKAHQELKARIRQWSEYLKDMQWKTTAADYATAVETRAMIMAIIQKLQHPPYQLAPRIPKHIHLLDNDLRHYWHTGSFIWPEAWQPAYPQTAYWWLYGGLKKATT